MSKTDLRKLLSLYEKLTPQERAELRKELGRRTSRPRRSKRAKRGKAAAPAEPLGLAVSESPSDQLLSYLGDVVEAWRGYLPLDGYEKGEENQTGLGRPPTLRALEPIEWLLKTYFRYEVIGLPNIPHEGRAIIVSNHGLLPLDGWFLSYEIMRHCGRWTRGLTDWRIFKLPYLRRLFLDMGVVLGSHDNGDALLQREELLFIMPGGSKEAWKSSKYRYRLLWRGRLGFVRLALRNQAPIIPSANVGTDDTYFVMFDGYTTAYKLFRTRRAFLPISVPIGMGLLPFPVKMTQYVGEPIYFDYPPEAADDDEVVRECQDLVKFRVYELIDRGLREREEKATESYRSGSGSERR